MACVTTREVRGIAGTCLDSVVFASGPGEDRENGILSTDVRRTLRRRVNKVGRRDPRQAQLWTLASVFFEQQMEGPSPERGRLAEECAGPLHLSLGHQRHLSFRAGLTISLPSIQSDGPGLGEDPQEWCVFLSLRQHGICLALGRSGTGPPVSRSPAGAQLCSQRALRTELRVLASLPCKCCGPLPDVRGPAPNSVLFRFCFFFLNEICLCPPVRNEYMLIIENVGKQR